MLITAHIEQTPWVKPRVKIQRFANMGGFALWPDPTPRQDHSSVIYCQRVNPGVYATPGDAAKALHDYRRYK